MGIIALTAVASPKTGIDTGESGWSDFPARKMMPKLHLRIMREDKKERRPDNIVKRLA